MNNRSGRSDFWPLLFGGIILFVGAYYFLRNTLGWDIGELDSDAIWPIIVIAIGASMVLGFRRHPGRDEEGGRADPTPPRG
jgi:uncharacterized membrane protein YhaH (DUF805 family)